MLKEKGFQVMDSKAGLGFSPPTPYRLKFSSHYIVTEENDQRVKAKTSVFDRIGEPMRTSAFDRLTVPSDSVTPHRSIRERLSTSEARSIA